MPPAETTAHETWRYVLGYLLVATGIFALLTVGIAIYNLTAASRLADGRAALDQGDVPAAFEALAAPHLFSGRRHAGAVLPPSDPLRAQVAGEAEERLAAAFNQIDSLPRPGLDLPRPEDCGQDPVCLVTGLTRPRQGDRGLPDRLRAFAYFAARRAMARGETVPEGLVEVLRRYPGFWVRAYRRQAVEGQGTATPAAPSVLAVLADELDGAVHGAWVFAGYGGLVTLILGAATIIWWRRRRPGQGGEPIPAAEAA